MDPSALQRDDSYNQCLSNCQIKSIHGWKYTVILGLTGALTSNFMPPRYTALQRRLPFFILTTMGIGLDWKTCADLCMNKYPIISQREL